MLACGASLCYDVSQAGAVSYGLNVTTESEDEHDLPFSLSLGLRDVGIKVSGTGSEYRLTMVQERPRYEARRTPASFSRSRIFKTSSCLAFALVNSCSILLR